MNALIKAVRDALAHELAVKLGVQPSQKQLDDLARNVLQVAVAEIEPDPATLGAGDVGLAGALVAMAALVGDLGRDVRALTVDRSQFGDHVSLHFDTDDATIAAANQLNARVRKTTWDGSTWIEVRTKVGNCEIMVTGPHRKLVEPNPDKVVAEAPIAWRPFEPGATP